MKVAGGIVSVLTTIALACLLILAGFGVCIAPLTTQGLATITAQDNISPFNRSQLVLVADATRDYAFGTHNEKTLYQTIYEIDLAYEKSLTERGGKVPTDFPKLSRVTDTSNVNQLKSAFENASEMYCYTEDTMAHLDDCNRIMSFVFPISVIVIAVAFVGLIFCGVVCRARRIGGIFLAAGIIVVVALIGLSAWAILSFDSFFTTFHNIFFSQGNWTFPYDSLLICALPTGFWMGMGVIWVLVSVLASVVFILIGAFIRRKVRRR